MSGEDLEVTALRWVDQQRELTGEDMGQHEKINDAFQMMAEQIDRSRVSLEELHGHGPASVGWSIDYQTHRSTATVTMPYDEDCPVCQALTKIEKLREDSDG